jgi:hypothetical protein
VNYILSMEPFRFKGAAYKVKEVQSGIGSAAAEKSAIAPTLGPSASPSDPKVALGTTVYLPEEVSALDAKFTAPHVPGFFSYLFSL